MASSASKARVSKAKSPPCLARGYGSTEPIRRAWDDDDPSFMRLLSASGGIQPKLADVPQRGRPSWASLAIAGALTGGRGPVDSAP